MHCSLFVNVSSCLGHISTSSLLLASTCCPFKLLAIQCSSSCSSFIGLNSGQQRENGTIQTIRQTWVSISLCFHLSLLKSTLPRLHTSTSRSTVHLTHAISSKHSTLSSVPLHHPHRLLIADDFATFFTNKTSSISSQFSAQHMQEIKPTTSIAKTSLFAFCPLTEA